MNHHHTRSKPFRVCALALLPLLIAVSAVRAEPTAPAPAKAAPAKADAPLKKGELTFDLAGKVREKGGVHEFFIPHPEVFSVLILPGDPKKLCAELSPEGAERMKDLEGLEVGRYRISGTCIPRTDGKPGHVITSIKTMMPLGDGVVRTDQIDLEGTLEVRGDAKAADWLTKSDMVFHGPDGVDFRIPAKKFAGKPSGLTYQDAALLDKQRIKLKAKAQFFRKSPHRIATINEFTVVKK
jgi:hypothetical protein